MKPPEFDHPRLIALLDGLIPAGDGFPAASETSCISAIFDRPEWAEVLAQTMVLLPADMATRPKAAVTSEMKSLEEEKPQLFQLLLQAVYATYYSDPAVLSIIAGKTGYRHPPQPFGYVLAAFDDAVLNTARSNPPSWRDTRI